MKYWPLQIKLLLLTWLFLASVFTHAQYYLTGTTLADSARTLPYVKIHLKSNGMMFRSGATGDFGIPSTQKIDSIICWAEGYDTLKLSLEHGSHAKVFLMPTLETRKQENERGRLSNLTPNLVKDEEPYIPTSGETYPVLVENPFVLTKKFPITGFSPNGNKASYANIRRFLNNSSRVNPNAVRIEEVINYFSLSCTQPPMPGEIFSIESRITDCPWNASNKLIFINALARELDFSKVPPANLVFLIDNSGSMDMPNRMPLLKSAFSMLVKSLRDIDRVAIITYGGIAGVHLPPTSGFYKDSILKAIDELQPGGATAGSGGIRLAYETATTNPIPGGNNRIILATDGDFNVGITAEKELEDLIVKYRKTGVNLTCLGLGMGNLKDSKIETLARHGNGNYAYLDSEQEAEKVMVQEFTQNLYTVASDVTIHAKLNPDLIKQYKLIGYENRRGALYNENSFMVGGEIGSGFALNALFEITLTDTSVGYISKHYNDLLGDLKIKFRDPSKPDSGLIEKTHNLILNYEPLDETDAHIRFVMASAAFGGYLKQSERFGTITLDQIKEIATGSANLQNRHQSEFLLLLETAQKIYQPLPPSPKLKLRGRKKKN
jgi:Ca-activated chloride channel family protein